MSQSEGTSNTNSTTRTSWKDSDKVKFFLDCCINEVARTGRAGTSLRKESWERVAKQLKEKYNMVVAQKQMKNQFDYLRSMYVEWSNLVNKNTGHGYNPITKTMDWTHEKWEEYLKAHPKASAFKVSDFRWEDEGKALFEGVSTTGNMGWGPASKCPRPSSTSSTNLHEIEDDQVDVEENTHNPTLAPDPSEPDTIDVQPSKKKKKVDDVERKFDKILDLYMMDAMNLKKDGPNIISEPTLVDCCKKLHAKVPVDKQTPYRGRGRDTCFQNVLAICDFNMIFTFIFAGWEGVAHDSRILQGVAYDPNHCFPFPPPDKYYLCDAAYVHTRYFMTPYRNTRYWINDFRRGVHAQGKEEVFNQGHAKLRNVIERTFGVLKARYRILDKMLPYSLATQRDIVIACCALHNFLRREKVKDQLFTYFEDPNACISSSSQAVVGIDEPTISTIGESSRQGDQQFMAQLRDQVANDLIQNRRARAQRQRHM